MAGPGLGLRHILSHVEHGWSRWYLELWGPARRPEQCPQGLPLRGPRAEGVVRRRGSRRSWGPHCKCRSTHTSLGPRAQELHTVITGQVSERVREVGWAALALPCEEPEGIWGSLLQAGDAQGSCQVCSRGRVAWPRHLRRFSSQALPGSASRTPAEVQPEAARG